MGFVERFSDAIGKLKAANRQAGKPLTEGWEEMLTKLMDGKQVEDLFNPILHWSGKCHILLFVPMPKQTLIQPLKA